MYRIRYVIISNIDGEQAIEAKYFIDSTGDGQLAYSAGAEYMLGNQDGYSSSPTLMFRVGNCDIDKLITAMESDSDLRAYEYVTYSAHKIPPYKNRENIANDKYAHFADFVPYMKKKMEEYPGLFNEWEKEVLLARGLIFIMYLLILLELELLQVIKVSSFPMQ